MDFVKKNHNVIVAALLLALFVLLFIDAMHLAYGEYSWQNLASAYSVDYYNYLPLIRR